MSLDGHKETSRRVLGLWGTNSSDRVEDFVAENYVNHQLPDVEGGVSDKSLEEWKKLVSDFHNSFSNATVVILIQIAEGDLVATRWQLSATHNGDFRGLAPTGREVSWTGVHTDRYDGDKIVESWVDWDKYSFLEGLGFVK